MIQALHGIFAVQGLNCFCHSAGLSLFFRVYILVVLLYDVGCELWCVAGRTEVVAEYDAESSFEFLTGQQVV